MRPGLSFYDSSDEAVGHSEADSKRPSSSRGVPLYVQGANLADIFIRQFCALSGHSTKVYSASFNRIVDVIFDRSILKVTKAKARSVIAFVSYYCTLRQRHFKSVGDTKCGDMDANRNAPDIYNTVTAAPAPNLSKRPFETGIGTVVRRYCLEKPFRFWRAPVAFIGHTPLSHILEVIA